MDTKRMARTSEHGAGYDYDTVYKALQCRPSTRKVPSENPIVGARKDCCNDQSEDAIEIE